MASEAWTRQLSRIEANRRRWAWRDTSHYDARAKRTHDLLGVVDALAFPEDGGVIAVQYTAAGEGGGFAARVRKIRGHENWPLLRRSGWGLVVWGWDGKTGKLRREEWLLGGGGG